ncbi:hypothetical protein QJS04_geneDACA001905 [Acorus gramineus]|uniref:Acyl-[acyl-carrier-protein] desaturase n=1 Tax=Acorus gramineus TaxID=55184 RepID=A0AAV9BLR5_ACOGR|nr:hypothetical protein QJS04_geneDACA001905 [Acorus gramineus]
MDLKLSSLSPLPCLSPVCSMSKPNNFITASITPYRTRVMKDTKKHSLTPEKHELFKSMEGWVEENMLIHLKPVEKSWQPQDFLPDLSSDDCFDEISDIRAHAIDIPDDYFVCLVGGMITEEALPTYQTMFNTVDAVRDVTGMDPSPWGVWVRAWTAEENRHGDLLNKYLYLCGRVDMRQIEKTTQYLIGAGMDGNIENNPYRLFVYTSFQEKAAFTSHANVAKHATRYGDARLAKMMGAIAGDEKRHESAYAKAVEKLFELDPDTTMRELADMMRARITMPGRMMRDGADPDLYGHYAAVAQRMGVYTTGDYVDIVEHFIGRWKVGEVAAGLSSEGRRAQDYVCGLGARMRRMEQRAQEGAGKKAAAAPVIGCSWVFNREVKL